MHFVCVLFLISRTAYYQRRLQRVFPVIWKDSVEDTGNSALESYYFFFFFFSQKLKKKIKNKKKKRKKKMFFKLLARRSPVWPVPWGVCHPVHHCCPGSGRMHPALLQEATSCLAWSAAMCCVWLLSPHNCVLKSSTQPLPWQPQPWTAHWPSSHKQLQ